MLKYGNPFEEEEKHIVHIFSRHILDEVATRSVREAKSIGEDLSLFRQKHVMKLSISKQKVIQL
jgi:hypothetical protein